MRRRGACTHQVVNTGLRAVGQRRGEFNRLAVQRCHQLVADAHTQFGVEALARNKHLGRNETTKRIAPQEDPCALTLLQAQDADGVLTQCGGIDLEQFVARVSVQDRLQRFGRVALGHDAGAGHDLRGALAHARNFTDRRRISSGGVEAQKAHFTDNLATRVETLDADVVEPGRAVHGGARHGLGHQHQFF